MTVSLAAVVLAALPAAAVVLCALLPQPGPAAAARLPCPALAYVPANLPAPPAAARLVAPRPIRWDDYTAARARWHQAATPARPAYSCPCHVPENQ